MGFTYQTMEVGAQELREGTSITAHTFQRGGRGKTEGVGLTAAQGRIEGKLRPLLWALNRGTGRIEELFLDRKVYRILSRLTHQVTIQI
jgi:hypothetical protein